MPLNKLLTPKIFSIGDGDKPVIANSLTTGLLSNEAKSRKATSNKSFNSKLFSILLFINFISTLLKEVF